MSRSASEEPPQNSFLSDAFRALRHRNYRLYFFGQLISLTGTWMQTTALGWLAYDLTNRSIWPSSIMTASILPTFLLGAWGGLLADRFPKRAVIFWTQVGFLAQAVCLALLVVAGTVIPWQLLALNLVSGIIQAADLPARLAFIAELTGREDLPNAISLNSMTFNIARIIGPAIGGWCLAQLGPVACFVVNAASYVAVLWALLCMHFQPRQASSQKQASRSGLLAGFRTVMQSRLQAILLIVIGITAMCGWPALVLLPALAKENLGLGANGYSSMLTATGFGAVAGGWTAAAHVSEQRRGRFLFLGLISATLGLLGLGWAPTLTLAAVASALLGYGLVLFQILGQTIIQLATTDQNRGSIMGIWAMVLSGAVPLGNLIFGVAADVWGLTLVLSVQAATCAVGALIFFMGRKSHQPASV